MHREQTDTELVVAAKENSAAFAVLFKKYGRKVYDYFFYRTNRNPDLADELAQETFYRALTHLSSYTSRGYSYLTYLLTIARNMWTNHSRRAPILPIEFAELVPDETHIDAERRSEFGNLWKAVSDLTPDEREIVLMRYRLGLSFQEIAKVTGRSLNAVKLVLSRARQHLRANPRLRSDRAPVATKRKLLRTKKN